MTQENTFIVRAHCISAGVYFFLFKNSQHLCLQATDARCKGKVSSNAKLAHQIITAWAHKHTGRCWISYEKMIDGPIKDRDIFITYSASYLICWLYRCVLNLWVTVSLTKKLWGPFVILCYEIAPFHYLDRRTCRTITWRMRTLHRISGKLACLLPLCRLEWSPSLPHFWFFEWSFSASSSVFEVRGQSVGPNRNVFIESGLLLTSLVVTLLKLSLMNML